MPRHYAVSAELSARDLRLRDRRCLAVTNDPLFEIQRTGYCVLESHFSQDLIGAYREGFWPILLDYLDVHREAPNCR